MISALEWQATVARLQRASSLAIAQVEIGGPVSQDDISVMHALNVKLPPDPIMEFFRSTNGVKLLWSGTLDSQPVQGSINFLTLFESSMRVSAQEGGEPLEGVLWNESFPQRILKELKRMAVFEAIAGESASLTYLIDEDDARLFLVEDDRIKRIVPDFPTTIELLHRYAGAYSLRQHLTHEDWEERIRQDKIFQQISEL